MSVRKAGFTSTLLFVFSTLSIFATFADAGEIYDFQGTSGFSADFYVIGGQYTLYLYVKRPIKGYNAPETRSCIFGGNLQRLLPTQDVISLGSGITISTLVPHKIGPAPVNLPAGLYKVFIATLTDCDWHLILESTSQNAAGIAPVRMFKISQGGRRIAESASITDQVEFLAQYRTEHGAQMPVSGVVQMVHGGTVVQIFPLQTGIDRPTKAAIFYVNVQFDQSDKKYLGHNTARFLVKIGQQEFASTVEFTLTP